MSDQFNIRALGQDDWQALKDIRLLSLKNHPGVYGRTVETEAAFADQHWIDMVTSDRGRIFGLFNQGTLIGINAVFTHNDDLSGKTGLMAMWYMRDEYKGQNLFPGLVQAGIDWARDRFDSIKVNHRGGNEASRANILKAGFIHIGTENWTWPDGELADYCMYEMRLR